MNFGVPPRKRRSSMNVEHLQGRFVVYRDSVYREGLLDDGFQKLTKMSNENNPAFPLEIIRLFFKESLRFLNDLEREIGKPDSDVSHARISVLTKKLIAVSTSVGAKGLVGACNLLQKFCGAGIPVGCRQCLPQLRYEYDRVRRKLETLVELGNQVTEYGGLIPSTD